VSLTVRRLNLEDIALVLRAFEEHFDEVLDEEALSAYLASERDHLLMAFLHDEAAGYLRAHDLPRLDSPPKMMLYDIETHSRFRRGGVARALIEALKELARGRGVRSIFVLTNAGNEAAMNLYVATGAVRPFDDDVMWVYDL
jgi:aminoglycoside 3-N-acetyltransferase I